MEILTSSYVMTKNVEGTFENVTQLFAKIGDHWASSFREVDKKKLRIGLDVSNWSKCIVRKVGATESTPLHVGINNRVITVIDARACWKLYNASIIIERSVGNALRG